MRRLLALLLAIAACALLAGGSSAQPAGEGLPVYAVTGGAGQAEISRRSPRTLARLGPAVRLGTWEHVAGLSPDGSLAAFVAPNDRPMSMRFLDVVRMRWDRAVTIPYWSAARWLSPSTLVLFGEHPEGVRAAIVDAERGRIVRETRIPGHLDGEYGDPTPAGLPLLLRPLTFRYMGPVLVGVVRPSGAVRVVEVSRILTGYAQRSRRPGLVADPSRSRAYVFGGLDEPVAEIDLRTLAVKYHALRGPLALEGTIGADRRGVLLAPGRMAIVGFDESQSRTFRLGLSLVDTSTWRLRRIDRDADFLAKSGDLLLGLHLDGSLAAFGLDGRRRFEVAAQVFQVGTVAANGRYVYAYNLAPGARGSALVVDGHSRGELAWARPPLFGPVLSPGLVVGPGA